MLNADNSVKLAEIIKNKTKKNGAQWQRKS